MSDIPIQTGKDLMVSVEGVTETILLHSVDYGLEKINFTESTGRILARHVQADSDLPPFDRIAMDGIAIKHEAFANGIRTFKIKGVQAAGNSHVIIEKIDECVEVMTGASLPLTLDTVIRYEDVFIKDGFAEVRTESLHRGQNIHYKGSDRKRNDVVAEANQIITPATIAALASTGTTIVEVKKLPQVLIVSTGNEIVEASETPGPFEIRSSNKYVVESALKKFEIIADTIHLTDDRENIINTLRNAIDKYDVLILCGGVSKGKFDFVPDVLQELGVKKHFHNVRQRPGKPFWFGLSGSKPVFAFPGNPVSVFLCLYRYMIPWLEKSLGLPNKNLTAILSEQVKFVPNLQYFLPVRVDLTEGRILAKPILTNGSGDFVNLLQADAFLELPAEREIFKKEEVFPLWPFKRII